ncbi:MAG: hypothetical protein LJE83_04965 [Gammaproteobacteria bacterium]|jgi:RNA-binding protein 25|nr:hypothetical protein [Gammaproteobacteria bacterium]
MKNINKAILIALGMTLPAAAMASADDDVTIRMMDANDQATQAVTRQIELPEAASAQAREQSAEGLKAANRNRNRNAENGDMDQYQDQEAEREQELEREMEREREREEMQQREMNRNDRKAVEQNGIDREEMQGKGPGRNGNR